MSKVRKAVNAVYESLADPDDGCFGLWINCLWHEYDTLDTFEEQKEAFFFLLQRLLDDGKVKLIRPGVDVLWRDGNPPASGLTINDPETHWDAPTDEIIAWLRERWPEKAKDMHDAELNSWFFTIPPLIWKGKDGMWHGS